MSILYREIMFAWLIIQLIFLDVIFALQINVHDDVEELTNNLFDNLRGDPHLIGNVELSETSKAFIDKQVENYMNLMLNLQENGYSRFKRSLPENEIMLEDYFVDLKPYMNISTTSPMDIVLFEQNSIWYAVCLEGQINEKYSSVLKLKKLQEKSFRDITEVEIFNGVMAAVFPTKSSTFIIVAENITAHSNFEQQTSIFVFHPDEKLEVVQRINTSYSSHVTIWELENNIYMSVAQFMKEDKHVTKHILATPIYKWCGRHFDVVQSIETSGAVKIEPFSIGGAYFLAVANSMSETGSNEVYSAILQYDLQTETYQPFQRILTYGCSDIRYFKINLYKEEEHFLIVANSQERGLYGNANGTLSIIYKFVDNYFLPFQSVKVDGVARWEPVSIDDGSVLLLAASTSQGLQSYQYDGWRFLKNKIQFTSEITSKGIRAMHFYKFQNKTVVVIANENDKGNSTNMFEINISPQNELQVLYNEMMTWCLNNEKIVQNTSDMEILGLPLRGDMSMEVDASSEEDETKKVLDKLKSYQLMIDKVEEELQNSLQSEAKHVIKSDLKAKEIILNNDGSLNTPQIETVNNIHMDSLFENLLNINEGFEIDNMAFNLLRTEEPIFPTKINNLSTTSILFRDSNFDVNELVINGNARFLGIQNSIQNINNVTIDRNVVLLKNGEQTFGKLNVGKVRCHELEAPFINDIEIESAEGLINNNQKIKKLEQLKAKKVSIGGFINEVDVPTLNRTALRISGDQVINKTYYFDSIEADNLETNTLSGKDVLNDFVPITGGRFHINKAVKFAKDLSVNNLTALNYFDDIPVKEGRLDVLERDSVERQYVPGIKSFENLELLNPIKLQGKIRSKDLDTMNPVVTIDSNLDLNGDIRITGDVIVEEIIKSNDIVAGDAANSLRRVRQQGMKLTDPEIPVHLSFFQHVNVREVFADRINNIDPDSWAVKGSERTQAIGGWKQFPGDLEITGDTTVFKMNGIDMEELEANVLRTDGDQVVTGRHYVKMAGAEKDTIVVDDTIDLNGHVENLDLDNILQSNNTEKQIISDMNMFNENVKVEGKVVFDGLLNNFNVSDICGFSSSGPQKKNLTVDGSAKFVNGPHVFDFNGYNVKNLQDRVWFTDRHSVVDGKIEFKNNVKLNKNVTVMGLINDISLEVLASNYFSKSKKQKVSAHIKFLDEVLFEDDLLALRIDLDGDVNGMNIENFIQTVLLHEKQLFEDSVYFQNLTISKLDGDYTVNNLNFASDIMRYDKPNQVTGLKSFKDLTVDNLLSDKNIKIQNVDILDWLKNSVLTKGSFQISGKKYFKNVTMNKGVSLMGSLNGHNFTGDTVMLKSEPQDIIGKKVFIRDTSEEIKFKAIKVTGLVNNVDVAERLHNQVQKTGDNILKSAIHFHNNVTAKNVEIKKLCQGINVTELLRNISMLDAINNFEDIYRSLTQMSNEVDSSLKDQAYFLHYFRQLTHIPNAKKMFGKSGEDGECQIMAFNFENGSSIVRYFQWNDTQNLFMDTSGPSANLGPIPTYIYKVNLGGKDYIFIENEVDPSVNEGYTHLGKLLHFNVNFTDFDDHSFYTKGTRFLTSFDLASDHRYCILLIYNDYSIDILCNDPVDELYVIQKITTEHSDTASVTMVNEVPFLATMKKGIDNEESYVTIWRLNYNSSLFEIHQRIYEEEPISLTMVSYNCRYYLAVAYGHLQNTMHLGRVVIRRFNEHTQEFVPWQNIDLKSPTHIEFAVLPSNELVLYILSDNPTEPFNVYMYQGISGFNKKTVGSAIPHITNMNQFSIHGKHFVVAEHYNEISIIEAVFKGEKLY